MGNNIGKEVLTIFEEGMKQAYHLIWSSVIKPLLVEHWFAIFIILLVLFVVGFAKAMFGRWGTLGSLIYNFLYFGTLLVVVLIWGTDIFTNDWFNFACAVVLYPVCYLLSGLVLDKFEFRRYRY